MTYFKALFTLFLLITSSVANSQVNLGYVNSERAIISHPSYDETINILKSYREELREMYNDREEEINRKLKEYEEAVSNGIGDEERKNLENEINTLDFEFQTFVEEAESKLKRKEDELTESLVTDLRQAAFQISEELELNAIFQAVNNEGVSFILSAPDDTELTDNILQKVESHKVDNSATSYKTAPSKVKIGYTNVELLMLYMPERSAMEKELESLENELNKAYKAKKDSLFHVYSTFKNAQNNMTESEKNAFELKISKMDEELAAFGSENQMKISNMRTAKTERILEKLQNTIDKTANANGFTFILNQTTSTGVSTILFGPKDCDITATVMDELRIPVDASEKIQLQPKDNLKVGFINVEALMAEMPEANAAKDKIEAFQTKIIKEQRNLANSRTAEENEKALVKIEQQVINFQNEQLLPIMSQIQTVIDTLAVKDGYDYIINQTGGNVLLVSDKNDLNPKMRTALNIK